MSHVTKITSQLPKNINRIVVSLRVQKKLIEYQIERSDLEMEVDGLGCKRITVMNVHMIEIS